MDFISFITPYRPITCGIADYSDFIIREIPSGMCDVISFNLDNYGIPLHKDRPPLTCPVWYGIPNRNDYTSRSVLAGLKQHDHHVLWFQHEFGIWRDNERFIRMVQGLDKIKIVSLHSLHFQSSETVYGLRRREYQFLHSLLPHVDAITVFSDGVYKAVTHSFPEYAGKVHVLRHGIHVFPKLFSMSRMEAREWIHRFLIEESGLDESSKDCLNQQQTLLKKDTIIMGGTGFITASKGIDLMFQAHSMLQEALPQCKIMAIYVGSLREPDSVTDSRCIAALKKKHNGDGQFVFNVYLPSYMLPVMLRALDVYFYWPSDCTQSGIIAHALGTGAVIACRDMEGVGETVIMAGGLTHTDFNKLVSSMKVIMLDNELRHAMSTKAMRYAETFSWKNQTIKHFALADDICTRMSQRLVRA